MGNIMDFFKVMIIVQLFFAVSITILTQTLPADSLNYVTSFSDIAEDVSLEGTSAQVEDSLSRQTNIPVIEIGALVFYSGNILIDLLFNFAFAVPEMVHLVIAGILFLFNVDNGIFLQVQLFSTVAIMVLYFIGVIQLLTGIRSGRVI